MITSEKNYRNLYIKFTTKYIVVANYISYSYFTTKFIKIEHILVTKELNQFLNGQEITDELLDLFIFEYELKSGCPPHDYG